MAPYQRRDQHGVASPLRALAFRQLPYPAGHQRFKAMTTAAAVVGTQLTVAELGAERHLRLHTVIDGTTSRLVGWPQCL